MTMTSSAARQLSDQNSEGTVLGASTTDKIAFYGKTAVAQQSSADQAAVTTTASTSTSPVGYSTTTQADAIVTLVNEMRSVLVTVGLMKGSA